MATALLGGHVNRAIDFLHSENKYFIIGGTRPWADESQPDVPSAEAFQLDGIAGLKSVDQKHLVVKDDAADDEILDENIDYKHYRDQRWRVVPERIDTTVAKRVAANSNSVELRDISGLVRKSRIRINNLYEGTITNITGNVVTLNTPAPAEIPAGSPVLGGALVDGAKYVYVDCTLSYDIFPVVTYRQIGLCTGVTANPDVTPMLPGILVSAGVAGREVDEYSSIGVLEVLDNRVASTRNEDQKELLSLIIEF